MTDLQFDRVPAVVVGVCGHGIALIRALHAGGVPVVAIEANGALPGVGTKMARVIMVPSIHGDALILALEALAPRIEAPGKPVLFLTNDSMVRCLGQQWERLDGQYRLSWADARARLTPLLDKPALEARCREVGIHYPETFLLQSQEAVDEATRRIGFPMIAKPARPLSGFKTALPPDADALRRLVEQHARDLPFLVQRFIPGDDRRIHFSALYLDEGRELARFDGHKLRSRPMGHTSIAEPLRADDVHACTRRFFDGLRLSGPVSLELKRDVDGSLWVIEPTVGRTDFWVGLCTANGVSLPLVEYRHQVGEAFEQPQQRDTHLWFNEDRDPLGPWWVDMPARRARRGRSSSYVFLHADDPGPAGRFLRQGGLRYLGAIARRLLPGWRGTDSTETRQAAGPTGLDTWRTARCWSQEASTAPHPFASPRWFELLARHCAVNRSLTVAPSVTDGDGTTHLPMRQLPGGHFDSLSNYYTALFAPASTRNSPPQNHGGALAAWLLAEGATTIRLHPIDPREPFWLELREALRSRGFWVDHYFAFGNWHHPCRGQRWQDYLAARPSRLRHSIQRAERRLKENADWRLDLLDGRSSVEAMRRAVADFNRVYARSWKKPEPHLTFVPALCELAHGEGWLRLCVLYIRDEPVSVQLWLVHQGTASIYKLAYDERFAKLGVGTLVSAALTRHVLDVDQVADIDFLAGDDPYKAEWMSARRERSGLIAFNSRKPIGWLHAISHFGARALRIGAAQRRWEGRPLPEAPVEPGPAARAR